MRVDPVMASAIGKWATQNDISRSEALRNLLVLGLANARPLVSGSPKAAAKSSEMAAHQIDQFADPATSEEKRRTGSGGSSRGHGSSETCGATSRSRRAGSSRSRWVVLKEAAIRKSRPGEKREVDLEDVVQLLRWGVRRVGSQMAFARIAGADRATVNNKLSTVDYRHPQRSFERSIFVRSSYPK